MLLENCCGAQAAPLSTFLLSQAHALWQWKKKLGWSEELNHGKDMCCCLILLKTEEEDLWQRRRAVSTEIGFIAFLSERWVCFLLIMDFVLSLSLVAGHYCSFYWRCFLGKMIRLSYFPYCIINFAYLASFSIVLTQLGGHTDQVLFIGNRTPVPLQFQRNMGLESRLLIYLLRLSPASGRATNCQD